MTDLSAESLRDFNSAIIEEFRSNGGKVGGPFAGATLLLLTTTGAKSGRPRLAPLAYLNVDGMMIVVGSKAGADTNPDWVYNLRANPLAHIEVGTPSHDRIESYEVVARELSAAERDDIYAKVATMAPVFGEYQSKTDRKIPLFELKRVSAE